MAFWDKVKRVLVDMEMIEDTEKREAEHKASEAMAKKAITVDSHDHLQQLLTMSRCLCGSKMDTTSIRKMGYQKRTFEVYATKCPKCGEGRDFVFDISAYFR